MVNQSVSESKVLSQKLEELEGLQAIEKDRLVSMNKNLESKIGGLEELLKTLLAQNHMKGAAHDSCKGNCLQGNCTEHEPGTSNNNTQRFGGRGLEREHCFWCGLLGHFQADCDDLKSQLRSGNVKVNPEGKLRLRDGAFIPNHPSGATLKEKVERHYSRKPSQFFN